MARVLILESDPQLAQKMTRAYQRDGAEAICADPLEPRVPEGEAPHLAIVDARMPWTVCRPLLHQLHQSGCPVLFVTADRRMFAHLQALYPGQSDVMVLPFSQKSLLMRTRPLLEASAPIPELKVLEGERVALLDGQRVELTAQEFALLLALLENPDTPISREQLLRKAWGYQSMGETRTVDVHVQRLRRKLGVERIETVYKCGYRLVTA